MNIRQLEIFIAVCETLSITKTAARLYLSQPAISKAIAELEAAIGFNVFDRIGGKLFLNRQGTAFYAKATRLIKDFNALKNMKTNAETLPLYIGVSVTLALTSLPKAIGAFKALHPQTPLQMYAENLSQIHHRLIHGDIDVAFTGAAAAHQGFLKEKISAYPLVLVCATKSPFSQKTLLQTQDILSLPFLLREKGSTLRDSFDKATHGLGAYVTPFIETINTQVLVNAAKEGLGITLLPLPIAAPYIAQGAFTQVNIKGIHLSATHYAITLKGKTKSPLLEDMIACFKHAEAQALALAP